MSVTNKEAITAREGRYLFVDLLMIGLLLINLSLILFDYLFTSELVKGILTKYTPSFYEFYDLHIHQDFLAIDLIFVSIFVFELLVRWGIAIKNRRYHRWFFYPFIHWYDVLGCLPIGSFRFLRILRVIGLTIRLHKLGFVDLTSTYLYQKTIKYINILTEEISDRVVLHVLTGVQKQIKKGNPLLEQIIHDLILPKRNELVEWLSYNLQQAMKTAYDAHIDDLHHYINQKMVLALESNKELKTISKIPVFGHVITENFERAICDVVELVIDECIQDLASPRNREVVDDVTHLVLDSFMDDNEDTDTELNRLVRDIALESLELIKEHVRVQQWKLQEQLVHEAENSTDPEEIPSNGFQVPD